MLIFDIEIWDKMENMVIISLALTFCFIIQHIMFIIVLSMSKMSNI